MSQSQLIGKFANVVIGYHWRDGEQIIEAKIIRQEGNKFIVYSKDEKEYAIDISNIKNLIQIINYQKYQVGDIVEAIVDYHQFAGESCDFGKIMSVKIFANNVDYKILILRSEKLMMLSQSSIKRKVEKFKAKYQIGQRIGVKHCNGHPYFYDEYIKNGTIISVNEWYDKIKYDVEYDDKTQETVEEYSITQPIQIKTQAQKDADYNQYLKQEEARLLSQLEHVRGQIGQIRH
jgi:hypothetical protein